MVTQATTRNTATKVAIPLFPTQVLTDLAQFHFEETMAKQAATLAKMCHVRTVSRVYLSRRSIVTLFAAVFVTVFEILLRPRLDLAEKNLPFCGKAFETELPASA